jgi:5-methylcytosine-specific restriction endonuclease McrA
VLNNFVSKHSKCAMCNHDKKLQVHHIIPWHISEALRYNEANLITLCQPCHFRFGHRLNWKDYNPEIVETTEVVKPFINAGEDND